MQTFKSIEDVEDWLEPMDYPGFWYAVTPYGLDIQDKASCDDQLANEGVNPETMLYVLKGCVRIELTKKFDLKHRELAPWLKPVESH